MKITLLLDHLWSFKYNTPVFKVILSFPSSVIYNLLLLPTAAPQLTSCPDGPLELELHIGLPIGTFWRQSLRPQFPPLKDLRFPEFCLHYTCWKPAKYQSMRGWALKFTNEIKSSEQADKWKLALSKTMNIVQTFRNNSNDNLWYASTPTHRKLVCNCMLSGKFIELLMPNLIKCEIWVLKHNEHSKLVSSSDPLSPPRWEKL